MSAVTVSPSGKLQASDETIARLKALVASDAEMLAQHSRRDQDVVFRVDGSDAVEVMIADLMVKCHAGAAEAFRLASEAAQPGGSVETYNVVAGQAARYSRALAELTVALSRHRGKPSRIVMEHHHHHFHQRIA
jgi:hypothetical protein